jgi:hypothetical protein
MPLLFNPIPEVQFKFHANRRLLCRELYVDVDASQFKPDQADQAQWEAMWRWRKAMDAVQSLNAKAKP